MASWCVGGASLCRESGAGVTALEPHPCFLDFQQLCFFLFLFFFIIRFRFKWKQGTVRSGLITVLRTGRSNRGSHGFLLFSHRAILDAKRTIKMNGLKVLRSDRIVRSGFQNLGFINMHPSLPFFFSLMTSFLPFCMYLKK